MDNLQVNIVNKLLHAIDSDDVEVIASLIVADLSQREIVKLQKMLRSLLEEKQANLETTLSIRQLLGFI